MRIGGDEDVLRRSEVDEDAVHHGPKFVVGRGEDGPVDTAQKHVHIESELLRIVGERLGGRIAHAGGTRQRNGAGLPANLYLPLLLVGLEGQRLFGELLERVDEEFHRCGYHALRFDALGDYRGGNGRFEVGRGHFRTGIGVVGGDGNAVYGDGGVRGRGYGYGVCLGRGEAREQLDARHLEVGEAEAGAVVALSLVERDAADVGVAGGDDVDHVVLAPAGVLAVDEGIGAQHVHAQLVHELVAILKGCLAHGECAAHGVGPVILVGELGELVHGPGRAGALEGLEVEPQHDAAGGEY